MFPIRRLLNHHVVFTLIVSGIILILLMMPDLYTSPYARQEERWLGTVLETDNTLVHQYGIVKVGTQNLKIRLGEGPFAGQEVSASNTLLGKMDSDKMFRTGDRAYAVLSVSGDKITAAIAYDHYRLSVELILLLVFAVFLIAFAGVSGIKAMLSFLFAIVIMWKVMLPCILQGYDPAWIALAVVTLISGVTLFLVAGNVRIAIVAWLGSLSGILLTTFAAIIVFPRFSLHGAIQAYSETLLYSGFDTLNLGRLFVAAILLGASGAVIDMAVDVAAGMYEVVHNQPDIDMKNLVNSGFAMGRAMVGTLVTTLLMAYMSGYMALLMVLISKGIPPVQILNLNFIAAEILKTVVGSFGLITVAPFTAIVGGMIYLKRRQEHDREESGIISAVQEIQN